MKTFLIKNSCSGFYNYKEKTKKDSNNNNNKKKRKRGSTNKYTNR